MKLIIAGSRDLEVSTVFIKGAALQFLGSIAKVDKVIEGGASGVDKCAKEWAEMSGIAYKEIKADWTSHGRAAGPIRNRQMAEEGDALLLVWDGHSKGSKNMKKTMLELRKPVYEIILESHNG